MAHPEQEPVAWISKHGVVYPFGAKDEVHPINDLQPLYTTPLQPKPLTHEQAKAIFRMARDLEDTGRLCSLSETNFDRLEWRSKNQHVHVALQDYLKSLTYTQDIKE